MTYKTDRILSFNSCNVSETENLLGQPTPLLHEEQRITTANKPSPLIIFFFIR